jgi:hypothetical protein
MLILRNVGRGDQNKTIVVGIDRVKVILPSTDPSASRELQDFRRIRFC